MARNVNRSRAGYNLRCKYYQPLYVKNETLEKGAEAYGVFYAKRMNRRLEANFNGSVKSIDVIMEVETPDKVGLLGDYYIEIPGDGLYKVYDQVSVMIDERGREDTTIILRRRSNNGK